jgi:hypothetical protein
VRFYVYHLVDPRDAAVFYVGKGSGDRLRAHVREAEKGVRSRKCDRIREIVGAGQSVRHVVVKRFKDEAAAYAFEADEIARIGLDSLTNVLPGGLLSPEAWARIEARRATKTKTRLQRETFDLVLDLFARLALWLAGGKAPRWAESAFVLYARSVSRLQEKFGSECIAAELARRGVVVSGGVPPPSAEFLTWEMRRVSEAAHPAA